MAEYLPMIDSGYRLVRRRRDAEAVTVNAGWLRAVLEDLAARRGEPLPEPGRGADKSLPCACGCLLGEHHGPSRGCDGGHHCGTWWPSTPNTESPSVPAEALPGDDSVGDADTTAQGRAETELSEVCYRGWHDDCMLAPCECPCHGSAPNIAFTNSEEGA
jgi:hypothetical protein